MIVILTATGYMLWMSYGLVHSKRSRNIGTKASKDFNNTSNPLESISLPSAFKQGEYGGINQSAGTLPFSTTSTGGETAALGKNKTYFVEDQSSGMVESNQMRSLQPNNIYDNRKGNEARPQHYLPQVQL